MEVFIHQNLIKNAMRNFIRILILGVLFGISLDSIAQVGNTSFGPHAGNPVGDGNTTAGYQSGEYTQGFPMDHITFLGYISGRNNRASYNTFIGSRAGELNTTGANNIYIGYLTGRNNTTGYENLFLGTRAGEKNRNGLQNTYLGTYVSQFNSTGSYNLVAGFGAGRNSQGGQNNVILGYNAGAQNQINDNIFVGTHSGNQTTTGRENTFLGSWSGANQELGSKHIFIGATAGRFSTGGLTNIFMGYASGLHNEGGDHNIFLGDSTGLNNLGRQNIFMGSRAGMSNEQGHNNVFIGTHSGIENTHGTYNTFLGNYAGFGNFNGAQNTFLGYASGYTNQAGRCNVFVGHYSGYGNIYGKYNTFMGYGAGSANTNGDQNVFIGDSAASANTTGKYNVVIGSRAGKANIIGEKNVFLGYKAGGNEIGSNKLHIANSASNTLIYGDFDGGMVGINTSSPSEALHVDGNVLASGSYITSDKRFKEDINVLDSPMDRLSKVEGVSYTLKSTLTSRIASNKQSKNRRFGFIAQDLKEVFPDMVVEGENGYLAVNYDAMIPVLVEALKELKKENYELEEAIAERDQYLNLLNSRLHAVESRLDMEGSEKNNFSGPSLSPTNGLGAIYPNPSSELIHIPYTLLPSASSAVLNVKSLNGKEVLSKALHIQLQGVEQISIKNLASGTYVCVLSVNGKIVDTAKILIE